MYLIRYKYWMASDIWEKCQGRQGVFESGGGLASRIIAGGGDTYIFGQVTRKSC